MDMAYRLARTDFDFDVDLSIPMMGVTGVYGVSGAGKTTLLRCIAGLERQAEGRLVIAGDVWQDSAKGLGRPVHERQIGYVFQEPRLFSHLDVRANLRYGQDRAQEPVVAGHRERIVELLGLEALLARSARALSGGEAQRVAIARALLRGPRVLLMDEPLASLDRRRKEDVLPFLDRLHAELSIPMLYVSHDLDEMCRLSDRLLVLHEGRVAAFGDVSSVLASTDPPVLPSAETSTMIETEIADHDTGDDITRLTFSGGEFLVAGQVGERGKGLRLRIKATDVSLCLERPSASSILNILPVQVVHVADGATDTPGMVLVRLRAGSDHIVARITRRSCAAMRIAEGAELYAQIKSASIRKTL